MRPDWNYLSSFGTCAHFTVRYLCSRSWPAAFAGALSTGLDDLSIRVACGTLFVYGWLSFRIREFNHRCP